LFKNKTRPRTTSKSPSNENPASAGEEQASAKPSAWTRALDTLPLRAKLAGDQSGDQHDHQADLGAAETAQMRSPVVQRQSAGASTPTDVPPSVHETLRAPGQPLDAGTRDFMESRFGHDFGGVRVHTDSQAAVSATELNAQAYTVGNHIVLSDYQPATVAGRAVLSHELAHTIQQRGAQPTADEQPGLEDAANRAAARVTLGQGADVRPVSAAPALQCLRVTNGGFGRALEEYTNIHSVADRVVRLLLFSPLFMQMARALDTQYVSRTDALNWEQHHQPLEYDAQHRITNGPGNIRGKRELMVVGGGGGASFEAFQAPNNQLSSDIIVLNPTSDAEFLRNIAHEAAHARNFVGQSGPAPATIAAAVTAGIQEEIDVRTTEQQVVSDIKGRAGRLGIEFGDGPTTVPAEVEREFSPGLGLTYLENIFFNWRLRETQASEGLTDDEAMDIQAQVDRGRPRLPLILGKSPNPSSGIYEQSTYAKTYFDYKTAQREWAELRQQVPPSDPRYQAREELLRQAHARRFFGGRVAYRPLPAATP
jgi:hypothetical protein